MADPEVASGARRDGPIRLPLWVEGEDSAPGEFVDLVIQAVQTLDLADASLFEPWEIEAFRYGTEHGCDASYQELSRRTTTIRGVQGPQFLLTKPGQLAFDRIPWSRLERFIPANDCAITPLGDKIHVQFRSLRKHRHRRGNLYYSPHRPMVHMDGRDYVIGFSNHVMQRAGQRINLNWNLYAGLGDLFANFHDCLHYEFVTLRNGDPAITFYDECPPRTWHWEYVREVFSRSAGIDPDGMYYYRVGYCPVVPVDGFLLAETILPPGFAQTPERQVIDHSDLAHDERRRVLDRAQSDDYLKQLHATGDFTSVRTFHSLGVPQVVWSRTPFYAPPVS